MECLDITIKVTCKNDKEAECIEKEIKKFKRRIKHIKNKEVNYEAAIVNLEDGKTKTIINKRKPREINH